MDDSHYAASVFYLMDGRIFEKSLLIPNTRVTFSNIEVNHP